MIPNLATSRLVLDGFTFEDSDRVELLAGHEAVARTTLNIPHPYPPGSARLWIATHALAYLKGEGVTFAVRLAQGPLIGCVGLGITRNDERGELGYWVGVDYWNQGFMTEAAGACLQFGFEALDLQKITSRHYVSNPASGRVMEKLGMKKEGFLRHHIRKGEVFHDVVEYGILKEEWLPRPTDRTS